MKGSKSFSCGQVTLHYVCCITYTKYSSSYFLHSQYEDQYSTNLWRRRCTNTEQEYMHLRVGYKEGWCRPNITSAPILNRESTTPECVQHGNLNLPFTSILHFNPSSHSDLLHKLQPKMKSLIVLAAVVNLTYAVPASPSDVLITNLVTTCIEKCPQVLCVEIWPQVGRVFMSSSLESDRTSELLLPQFGCPRMLV
jgi:hypothetical protein